MCGEQIELPFEKLPEVLIISDNQINNLYGNPINALRNGIIDKVIPVAIRPVQQDLFCSDLLQRVVEAYGAHTPVIHLGDAANTPCVCEHDSFFDIMKKQSVGK